jgi:hypothetical protein
VTEDVATAFLRALRASFAGFAGVFRIEELVSRTWASVTFSGARHRVSFTIEGPGAGTAADAFVSCIGETQFDLRDHILADLSLAGDERSEDAERVRISLEALTVEDA